MDENSDAISIECTPRGPGEIDVDVTLHDSARLGLSATLSIEIEAHVTHPDGLGDARRTLLTRDFVLAESIEAIPISFREEEAYLYKGTHLEIRAFASVSKENVTVVEVPIALDCLYLSALNPAFEAEPAAPFEPARDREGVLLRLYRRFQMTSLPYRLLYLATLAGILFLSIESTRTLYHLGGTSGLFLPVPIILGAGLMLVCADYLLYSYRFGVGFRYYWQGEPPVPLEKIRIGDLIRADPFPRDLQNVSIQVTAWNMEVIPTSRGGKDTQTRVPTFLPTRRLRVFEKTLPLVSMEKTLDHYLDDRVETQAFFGQHCPPLEVDRGHRIDFDFEIRVVQSPFLNISGTHGHADRFRRFYFSEDFHFADFLPCRTESGAAAR